MHGKNFFTQPLVPPSHCIRCDIKASCYLSFLKLINSFYCLTKANKPNKSLTHRIDPQINKPEDAQVQVPSRSRVLPNNLWRNQSHTPEKCPIKGSQKLSVSIACLATQRNVWSLSKWALWETGLIGFDGNTSNASGVVFFFERILGAQLFVVQASLYRKRFRSCRSIERFIKERPSARPTFRIHVRMCQYEMKSTL